MHTEPDLRVFLEWMIAGSGLVSVAVVCWATALLHSFGWPSERGFGSLTFIPVDFMVVDIFWPVWRTNSPMPLNGASLSITRD